MENNMAMDITPDNQKLSNDITSIRWNDWTFTASDTTRVIVEMVSFNLSYRQIAKIFGVSHQTINKRIQNFKHDFPDEWEIALSKERFYTEFKNLYQETKSELILEERFQLSQYQVKALIRKLFSRTDRLHETMMENRFDDTAQIIFGYQFKAGENFRDYILEQIKTKLKGDARKRLIKYINGDDDPRGKDRLKRKEDRHELQKQLLTENIKDLLEREILCVNKLI